MICPLIFTAIRQGIDVEEMLALHEKIMAHIDFYIRYEYQEDGGNPVVVVNDENYIVNDQQTIEDVKRRKELTEFTERAVAASLKTLGYEWQVLKPDVMNGRFPDHFVKDKLTFSLNIDRANEMLFYKDEHDFK